MLGAALYYPHIDIYDPVWLRSAILFWDSLQTIAPRAVRSPYRNGDTRILWQEGFLEPLRCDLHPELLDTLGRRVIALMDHDALGLGHQLDHASDPNAATLLYANEVGMQMRDQFHLARIYPDKLSRDLKDLAMRAGLASMHPEKLSPEIRDLLDELRFGGMHSANVSRQFRRLSHRTELLRDADGEWLLVDGRFAKTYMSALAALLAKEADLSALTNEEPSMAINLHTLLEDVKPSVQSEKKGALVSFIMEAIRVDPETRVDRLLAFRRSRADQLAELSAQFDDISSRILNCETARELEESARDTYVTRIRPKLESLKGELRDNSIQSVWDGIQRAVTISVPGGGALAYFSGFNGTTLLAAGAAIAVTDVAVRTHLARRKTRRASPYTYLLDIERKFSLPC